MINLDNSLQFIFKRSICPELLYWGITLLNCNIPMFVSFINSIHKSFIFHSISLTVKSKIILQLIVKRNKGFKGFNPSGLHPPLFLHFLLFFTFLDKLVLNTNSCVQNKLIYFILPIFAFFIIFHFLRWKWKIIINAKIGRMQLCSKQAYLRKWKIIKNAKIGRMQSWRVKPFISLDY